MVVKRLVNFENHRTLSGMINSSSTKKIVFHLLANYLTLLIITFENQDFELISSQVSSFVVTTSIIYLGRVTIKPIKAPKTPKNSFFTKL